MMATLLTPDSFPRNWYGALTSQTGHAAAVGIPMALILLGCGIPAALAPPAAGVLYFVAWERGLQRGADLGDSIADAAHVAAGALIITAALSWGFWPTVAAFVLWAAMLGAVVVARIGEETTR